MDADQLHSSLTLVRAVEVVGDLESHDWPGVAVALLLEGADVPELDELAGLRRDAQRWEVAPLVDRLYDRFQLDTPSLAQAVEAVADALATDLRRRPAHVTGPMVRIVGGYWPAQSDLADRAWEALEFLDCGCDGHGDEPLLLEAELERRPDVPVPDGVLRAAMTPVRAALPREQPPAGH